MIVINSNAQSVNEDSKKKKLGESRNIFTQIKYEFGGVLPKVKERGIVKYNGLDLRVAWQKKENSVYSTIYEAPKFGIGFYSGAFGNDAFGEPNGLYGFFERQIGHHRKKLNWVYSIGFGLAFNFNYFDPVNNPTNELVGSGKNIYIAFSMEARYNLTEHWVAGLGVGFKHFSNGRVSLPNLGINILPFTISTEYNFGDSYTDINTEKLRKFIPFNMLSIFGAAGFKKFEYGEAAYFKSTLSVNALRQFDYKFRYGLGFEIFYTAGSLDRVIEDKGKFNKQNSYGFTGLFEWVITERLYIPLNIGIYLNKNEENSEKLMYNRIGIRYLLGKEKKMMIGLGLKITELHADYLEWTIGYTFKKDKNKYELLF
jgi:Lipid A 3-O-deacylase (PagL)